MKSVFDALVNPLLGNYSRVVDSIELADLVGVGFFAFVLGVFLITFLFDYLVYLVCFVFVAAPFFFAILFSINYFKELFTFFI